MCGVYKMAFDKDKKAKIRESMDYDSNGRLTAVVNKALALDAPILIVGLGGTGVGATLKVKKMIYDRLQCEQKNGVFMDKPRNIEYLVMDTDMASKNMSIGGVGFSEAMDESFVFTCGNIQAKLQSPNLPSYIANWVDKDIDLTEVVYGAGAVRQVGRFMLFDNIKRVIDAIEAKIVRVTTSNKDGDGGYGDKVPLYVFVLAGISGGTGSGTFIDIAYLIKGIARKINNNRVVKRIGLLFLPDVNLAIPGISDTKKENLKKNGFAALKELDYLMNINNQTGDCFEQDYGTVKIGPKADGDIPPFETCILISSTDSEGRTKANSYEYTLAVAAETVLNFVASEEKQSVDEFSINSFISNSADEDGTYVTMLENNISPVNYKYAVAGASSAVIPLDDIMSYMAYLAFEKIDGLWNRIPDETEVKELLQAFDLEVKAQEQQLCLGAPKLGNMGKHTFELIKQSPQLIVAEFDGNLEQRKRYLRDKKKELLEKMQARVAEPQNPINDIFKDINRGPVFANRILCTHSNNPCVLAGIDELRRYFSTNVPPAQIVDVKRQMADRKLNELLQANPLFQGGKRRLRDEFVEAQEEYYNVLFKIESYNMLQELCAGYYDIFLTRNNEIYENVSELLGTLVELFNKYAAIKSEATETQDEKGKTLSWSVAAVPDFIKELEKRMGSDAELKVDLYEFIKKFYVYLFENVDIWSGKERADVVERLNRFISESFSNVLDKSMDYYVKFIAEALGKEESDYAAEICSELVKRASIKFPFKATYSPVEENPSYSFVSVPMDAKSLRNTIEQSLKTKSNVKESGIRDRIFMMNYKSAMPLAAYRDLAVCHAAYGRLSDYKHGLHLYESKLINWRDLPSPLPESEWEGGHEVVRERAFNQKWRQLFDKALEYGFIKKEQKAGADRFVCYWGDLLDANGILAKHNVNIDQDMVANDALAALQELRDRMDNAERLSNQKDIYWGRMKTLEDGSQVFDVDFAKEIFIKMVMVRGKVEEMVRDYERAVEVVEKLKPFTARKKFMLSYIKMIYTETLTKQRGEYVYFDKNGAVQNFCYLEGTQNVYPEYYLFNHLFAMKSQGDGKKADELVELTDRRFREKQSTNESYESMMDRLQEYVNVLKEKIGDLNGEWRDVDDGQMVLSTYQELERIASAELLNR